MNWLKRLFSRPLKIVDPMFGAMTLENGGWLALPDADRHHMIIFEGNATGPTEQQRSRYTAIIQKIDSLIDKSMAYVRSQRDYAESIGPSNLELYAVIITNDTKGADLDFTLELSPDEDAIIGVNFVADRAVNCYLDH